MEKVRDGETRDDGVGAGMSTRHPPPPKKNEWVCEFESGCSIQRKITF